MASDTGFGLFAIAGVAIIGAYNWGYSDGNDARIGYVTQSPPSVSISDASVSDETWRYDNPTPPQPQYIASLPTRSVYYANCSEARAAGAAPVYEHDEGYAPHLDRDADGVGCE